MTPTGTVSGNDHTEPDGWRRIARAYRHQEWLERSAIRAALDLAGNLTDCRILDAGAGTGLLAQALAVGPQKPATVVLVDSSPAMLAQARRRIPSTHGIVHADLRSIPLDDASVDVAFVNYVLHIVEPSKVPEIIGELHRVVRPEGTLICVTPMAAGRVTQSMMRAVSRAASRTPAWRLGGLRPMDPTTILEQAGFLVTQTKHVGRGYPSLCVRAIRHIAAPGESQPLPRGPNTHGI